MINLVYIYSFLKMLNILIYHIVPKFSDRQVWANSVDPDQTAPRNKSTVVSSLNKAAL